MKTSKHKNRSREGSAFITIMLYAGIVTLVVGYMLSFSLNQPKAVRRTTDYLKAKAIAEAGANQAYSILATNFAARNSDAEFPLTEFGGGSYDATVTPKTGSNGVAMAVISSVGTCRTAIARAVLEVTDFGGSSSTNGGGPGGGGGGGRSAYEFPIVSKGRMNWSGSGTITISNGTIHSDSENKMTGSKVVVGNLESSTKIWLTGSTEIQGDVDAPIIDAAAGAITGDRNTNAVPTVAIPNIDLTPYYNAALDAGTVVSGSPYQLGGSADYAPPGGILWVNGDFKWSGSGQFIGCVIATGDVNWSGSGDQVKVAGYPAIVSRDGDISISSSADFHGLIYTKTGNIDMSGSGEVTGTIIANGTFDSSGSWDVMIYEDSTPVPPVTGGETNSVPASSNIVVVTGWQQ